MKKVFNLGFWGQFYCGSLLSVFGVRELVTFNLMYVHIILSSV